ncbi:efflux RND transporter periplasmic adaptor subunit [uncultured Brevundimonas sp.]|uniref:HlyD family secretion protein n=1 Tax=uncultured Brevundimonas sp. TaxID=213418 RepID=UPI0025E33776|nr:efflux RND transporter periplasmic adaptor subunit [uncultured Brevundimonas sp.]
MTDPAPVDAPTAPRRRPRATIRTVLIGGAVLAVLVFIGVGLYLAARPAAPQVHGMVEAETFTVATKAPARVEQLLASAGDRVAKGQALAILSSPEIEARDQQAVAALQGAEAVQQLSRLGARAEDVRSLESIWRSSQAASRLAAQTARRAENLFAEGVISAQRRDEAVAARAASAAQSEAARQQYLKAVAGTREQDKAIADAQVAAARAGVGETQSLQSETRLVAPVAGEIAERFANPGELVLIGVPVFTVIDLGRVWVSFNLKESDFAGLKIGQTVRGDIPALNRKAAPFRVTYISPQGDFATWRATRQSRGYDVRSFEIHAEPVTPVQGLRPGMSVLFDWPAR